MEISSQMRVGNKSPTTFLDFLARDLSTSLFRATRHGLREKVAVLTLHWANDDLGVDVKENDLLHLFETVYRFNKSSPYTDIFTGCYPVRIYGLSRRVAQR